MKKICSRCKQEKETTEFYRHRRRKDGYSSECKECSKISYFYERKCQNCGNVYTIKHRNVKKRKTDLCRECVIKHTVAVNMKNPKLFSIFNKKGYEFLRDGGKGKYKLRHRKLMEQHIGRELTRKEVVHHKDGNRINNVIDNLFLCATGVIHANAHASLQILGYELMSKKLIKFNLDTAEYEYSDEFKKYLDSLVS